MENLVAPMGLAPSSAARSSRAAATNTHGQHPEKTKGHTQGTPEEMAQALTPGHGAATVERGIQQGLNSARGWAMAPAGYEFLGGGLLAWPLTKLAKLAHWDKGVAAVGSVLKAPVNALRSTTVADAMHLPENVMRHVARESQKAGVRDWSRGALGVSKSLAGWGSAITESIKGFAGRFTEHAPEFMKSAAKVVGKQKLFPVLMVGGVAVGLVATLFGSRAESKESNAAFKAVLADIPDTDKEGQFSKAIKHAYASKGKWGVAKTGIEMAGGVMDGIFWIKPGMGGMAMMGMFAVPQIGQMLVPDSPFLSCCAALQAHDAGKVKLEKEQRIEALKPLIAIIPSVEKHGGIYNRAVTPLATKLVEQGLNTKQIFGLLNDQKAFTALAEKTIAELPAIKTPKAKQTTHSTKQAIDAVGHEVKVVGNHSAANAPQVNGVQLAGSQHMGRVSAAPQRVVNG